MPRLVAICLLFLVTIGCGAVGCNTGAARQDASAPPGGEPSGQASQSSAPQSTGEIPIGVSDAGSTLDVGVQLEALRAVRRVVSKEGGTLRATAGDGSTFILTIPPGALVGREEIILTPVASMTGLPAGVTLAAGVQMAPDGLFLLKPATLTIEPTKGVAADQEVTFGWARDGRGVHAQFPEIKPRVPTFQISHFSGAAVAAGGGAGAEAIIKGQALPCGGQFFAELGPLFRRLRRAALAGSSTPEDAAKIVEAFNRISRGYLDRVLKPVAKQAETDDLLLPCAIAAVFTWERQAQLLLGDSHEQAFGADFHALDDSIHKGIANAFNRSYERCMRNESPLFQLGWMMSAARQLEMVSMSSLLPADATEKALACGRNFEYLVDVETAVENVYNEQGQGIDIASSKTTIRAGGLVAKFDQNRSRSDAPIFVAAPVNADATVTIVPRHPCPDQARIAPGATLGVTIEPILNTRVGELRCASGKARCDRTDVNPGVLVHVAPLVVENTYLHTYTSSGCDPVGYWNEFMMAFQGRMSAAADALFQVRGDQDSVTVVRHGTSKRRRYLDIAPAMLKLRPGMKDYVDIDTPAIKTATDRTRISIKVKRR